MQERQNPKISYIEINNFKCFLDEKFNLESTTQIVGGAGSGKTSFVEALAFARDFVINSSGSRTMFEKIDTQPNIFDADYTDEPTSFKFEIPNQHGILEYYFELNKDKVLEEYLVLKPLKGKTTKVFHRKYVEYNGVLEEEFYINPKIKGIKKLWKDTTRENALFVSTAIQCNASAQRNETKLNQAIDDVYNTMFFTTFHKETGAIRAPIKDFDERVDVILWFLQHLEASNNIVNIEQKVQQTSTFGIKHEYAQIILHVLAPNGKIVPMKLEQSPSTVQKLYDLSLDIVSCLETSGTLVVELDILDSETHKTIVEMFNDPSLNVNNSSLVFTTREKHDNLHSIELG